MSLCICKLKKSYHLSGKKQRKNSICHSHKCSKLYCRLCKSVCLFSVSTSDTLCHMHLTAHSGHSCKSLRKPGKHTTNSDSGVTSIDNIFPVLEAMAEVGLPLLVHGEVTRAEVDVFDREKRFIDEHLTRVVERFPTLKVVFEHITTGDAAAFVKAAPANVGATITAHHLLYNRNHMLVGGIRPHFYCLPILKRNTHQDALLDAATSGNPKFFLGTDSAPHAKHAKEAACGCAGCYTAHAAIELYAEAFEQRNALDKLEGFASCHGPDFYGLPRNTDRITLVREDWVGPTELPLGEQVVIPLRAGEKLRWRLLEGQA